MSITSTKPTYRPDIDGLRAIAVIAVVFYHAKIPGFSGGFAGVDVFFVISGFLITTIVWGEIQGDEFSLIDFYARRIRRIFPALFAVLTVATLAAFILLIPNDLAAFGKSIKATVLFYSNFHQIKQNGYFAAPSSDDPLLHTWSLSVEEQFYALWPLVLLLMSRFLHKKRVPYYIAVLFVISLALSEARMPNYQKDAFYFPWCRGWELLIGSFLATSPLVIKSRRLAQALGAAGAIAIGLTITLYDPSTRFPGFTALLPCMGAACLIASGSRPTLASRLLSFEPVRRIGLISYSLYLIHWPVLVFAHLYLNESLSFAVRLLAVSASFALSFLSWRFIEKPCRQAHLRDWKIFAPAIAATSFLFLIGSAVDWGAGFPERFPEGVLLAQDLIGSRDDRHCRGIAMPAGAKGDGACEFGEEGAGAYQFLLWGDSHAHHFIPAIGMLAKVHHLSGVILYKSACHPFIGDKSTSPDCRAFNNSVANWIAENPVKLVILGGRWSNRLKNIQHFMKQPSPTDNMGGLATTLAFLANRGIEVTILDQGPEFTQPVNLCVSRARFYGRSIDPCLETPAEGFLTVHRELGKYFEFLKRAYKFTVASAANRLCDRAVCKAADGGTILMMDDNHLTEAGALYLAPYLKLPLLNPASEVNDAASSTVSLRSGAVER